MRPETSPAERTSRTDSRTAQGDTAPRAVTGSANISIAPRKEPMNAPAESPSKAPCAAEKRGRVANGTTASATAAPSTSNPRARSVGCRSASRPPSQ